MSTPQLRRLPHLIGPLGPALHKAVLLWGVKYRQLAANPETVAEVSQHAVRLLLAIVTAD